MKTQTLKSLVIAQLAAMKAQDITVLDIAEQTTITDLFIIANGSSKRHRQALAERVCESLKASGIKALGQEGYTSGEWILIDLGDIVVHIMEHKTRLRYDLEGLWKGAEASYTKVRDGNYSEQNYSEQTMV